MDKKRVFLTRTLHEFALKELKKKYLIEVHSGKIPISRKKLSLKMKEVEGLICFPYDVIDKELIDKAKNLKIISTFSVGFDHIDVEYAKTKKIRVGYTPEVLTDATADLAFSLLLDIMRRVSEGDRTIRKGNWRQIYGAYDYVGTDLQNKTLGIFGLGRIGSVIAKRAKAFDMKLIYHNRKPVPKSKEKRLGIKFVSFKQLISQSDVISVHVPHNKQTNQIFDKKVFSKMKKTSFLINTARGKIINEIDLVDAL
ncbi:MAG: D-glycerate dehydrogenase, partial [Nitrosopumilaceae archaeon]|nr:D-glycerate dehydrogenase [Nitrosopumilaceae archaeon]